MPNWGQILQEIGQAKANLLAESQKFQALSAQAIDLVRRSYLSQLHNYIWGRNIISYYPGWLSKPNNIMNLDIVDEDKNGFMMAVHTLDRTRGLDLLLHTPGGSIAATESIVHYLRQMFPDDIRAIVPQIAMSAGTMIACACNSILMAKHSNLGPIDPRFGALPAHGVIQEFRQAYSEIKLDPAKAQVWQSILAQYPPTFLSKMRECN